MIEISRWETKTIANSLENLMKQGLSDNYWNETIFQPYVNHKPDVIYLQGLPYVSSSRPHKTDVPKFASILSDIIGVFGLVNLLVLWLNSFIYSVTLFYGFTWPYNRSIESQPVWADKGCGSRKQIKLAL